MNQNQGYKYRPIPIRYLIHYNGSLGLIGVMSDVLKFNFILAQISRSLMDPPYSGELLMSFIYFILFF
jgi:hypothetical protein